MKSSLFFAVVDEGKADGLMRSVKKGGGRGGTILTARASASNSLLCLLGLGDSRKEILLSMVDEPLIEPVWNSLVNSKHFRGTAASFAASWDGPSEEPEGEHEWDLITIICNHGHGDDILAAVRKIQPVGGLIVDGRGTAQTWDIPFFWAHLVPEKEVVFVFVPAHATDVVLDAVSSLKSFKEEGSGIAFTLAAQRTEVRQKSSIS